MSRKSATRATLGFLAALVFASAAQAHPGSFSAAPKTESMIGWSPDRIDRAPTRDIVAESAGDPIPVEVSSNSATGCMSVPPETPLPVTCLADGSLSDIGGRFGVDWKRLYDGNMIADPNIVPFGQEIHVPAADEQIPSRDLPLLPEPSEVAVTPMGAAASDANPPPSGDISSLIYAAADRHHISGKWLHDTAVCESGLDPTNWHGRDSGVSREYAVSHNYPLGLFQFKPSTFYGNGGGDIWSAYDQAELAATMFASGQSGQWACA